MLYGSVKVMKTESLYGHGFSTNLEPVYGIILAYFIIGGKKMSLLCRSRNYHHYSNFKWDYQTQGR
jgi:hypothetical protein